ncbi:MAG: hypothetical protein KBF45_00580 [Cyclobacteriaceae bacterium]|jgi:hypothetical protein|nr:hypothetical protein [Cyclobacteriaceae bacterium]
MRVDRDIYKGIEYITLAGLPPDQKEKIVTTLDPDKIIKILKDGVLINDCIQYADYLRWFEEQYPISVISPSRVPQSAEAFSSSRSSRSPLTSTSF